MNTARGLVNVRIENSSNGPTTAKGHGDYCFDTRLMTFKNDGEVSLAGLTLLGATLVIPFPNAGETRHKIQHVNPGHHPYIALLTLQEIPESESAGKEEPPVFSGPINWSQV